MEFRTVAITISPPLRKGNPRTIYRSDIVEHFKYLLYVGDFEIYPEFDQNGRLHYHGVVYIKDNVKWLKQALPALHQFGFTKVVSSVNEGWFTYMMKEFPITREVLDIMGPLDLATLYEELDLHKQKLKEKKDKLQNLINKIDLGVEPKIKTIRDYLRTE